MPLKTWRRVSLGLAVGLASLGASGLPAWACGGLFCQRVPVDQAGERILFAADGEHVTAYVQIQYQGEAKDFSWIVPVPTKPEVSVGSDALFGTIRSVTRPRFNVTRVNEGDCAQNFLSAPTAAGAVGGRAAAESADNAGVNVVERKEVGPYDAVTLEATDSAVLRKWLTDNGYTLPAKLDPLLDPYVAGKYLFVAVKLLKDASVGEVKPLVLKYAATKPGIPIRLTGVAATNDMDVYVWVLGKQRAVPENYRHAIINEARIDWFSGGSNYRDVVTEAMNEAGGQAFVTDFSGPSKEVDLSGFSTERFRTAEGLKEITNADSLVRAVRNNRGWFDEPVVPFEGGFARGAMIDIGVPSGGLSEGAVGFLRRLVKLPAGLVTEAGSEAAVFQNERYADQLKAISVDGAKAYEELRKTGIAPAEDIRKLFGELPVLTQMYTTMSPDEMTQDPMFVFNGDLPEVKADHNATAIVRCGKGLSEFEAPVTFQLANGISYDVPARGGPGRPVGGASPGTDQPLVMPAALRIEQLKASGGPSLIQDNTAKVTGTIETVGANGGGAAIDPTGGAQGKTPTVVPRGGSARATEAVGGFGCAGCSNTQSPPLRQGAGEGAALALVFVGFLGYRRWAFRKKP